MKKTLEKLGLHPDHADIYLHVLSHADSSVSDISRGTQLHRVNIYRALPLMMAQGLIAESRKGKRRIFSAKDPQQLERLLEERRDLLEQALPELAELQNKNSLQPKINIDNGHNAIQTAYDRLMLRMRKDDVYYRFTSRRPGMNYKKYLSATYLKLNAQKKPNSFVITNPAAAATYSKKLERDHRIIPSSDGVFEHNINVMLYHDTTLFVDYGSETVLEIQHQAFTNHLKQMFKSLHLRIDRNAK